MKEKKEENQFAERLFFYFALITPRLSNDVDYHIIDVSKSFSLPLTYMGAFHLLSHSLAHFVVVVVVAPRVLTKFDGKSVVCDIFCTD